MKIVFLHLTQGLVDRGMEQVVSLYARSLSRTHSVTVIQSGKVKPGLPYHTLRRYPLAEAPQIAPRHFLDKLRFRYELDPNSVATRNFTLASLATLRRLKPDVIIVCNGAPALNLLHAEKLGIPLVAFGAAGLGHHDQRTLRAVPDLFIALTETSRAWAARYALPGTKLVTIPNPVILRHPQTKPKLTLPHPIVLTVGALTAYKNILKVAAALSPLPLSHLIIGDGELSGELQHLLSTRAHDFSWIRHVEPDLLPAYYQLADAFCFTPDPREAFGNVYLEAMAHSLPIVATDDPLRREIIGPAGYYVNPDDPAGIRTAVALALTHGRVDYSERLKRYNVKTVTRQLESALYDLLNSYAKA